MQLDLDGRAFVVGGGSRGLGRAVAAEIVEQGARVLLLSRGGEALESAASELGELASAVAFDMSDPEAARRVRDAVGERFDGRLDGVLLNHGGPKPGEVLSLSDEDWRGAFELVIGGPIRLLRELVPLVGEGGSIVWIASTSARQPIPGLDLSNAFRPGVGALVKVLARELAPRIRVNGIAPGMIDTDRIRELNEARAGQASVSSEELRGQAAAGIPLGRIGEPAELGRVAAFLLSPEASYVTGTMVQVDGGLVSALP